MSLARRARLARLAARLNKPIWPDPEERRRTWEHHVRFCLLLRETLARLGVDPAEVAMLRIQGEAEEKLAALGHAIPDRPDPESWQASYLRCAETLSADLAKAEANPAPPLPPDDKLIEVAEELERMVQSYLDDPAIDFSKVSLVQVLAWCAARLIERSPAARVEQPKGARAGAICC